MPRREFRLHRPCTWAVDFTRINREALTRGPQLLAALPRRRRLLSIFPDNGKWLDFRAKAQGADLTGFVAHAPNRSARYASRSRGLIASAGPATRRRRAEGQTLFQCEDRFATWPDGDDRSGATNARLRIHEKGGAAGGSFGRPIRISVQAEGRHQ
jgi:hypothetical protein